MSKFLLFLFLLSAKLNFSQIDFQRFRIQLTTSNNWEKDAVIVFKDDATEAYHEMYDVLRLPGSPNAAIFTVVSPNEYTLKAFPTLTSTRIVDIGVVNTFAGTSKLSITEFLNFEPTTRVYLRDNVLDTVHNFNINQEYVYNNIPGLVNRFSLEFRAPLVITPFPSCIGDSNGKFLIINPNNDTISLNITKNNITNPYQIIDEILILNLESGEYVFNLDFELFTKSIGESGFNIEPNYTISTSQTYIIDATIEFTINFEDSDKFIIDFGDGTITEYNKPFYNPVYNPVHTYNSIGLFNTIVYFYKDDCIIEKEQQIIINDVLYVPDITIINEYYNIEIFNLNGIRVKNTIENLKEGLYIVNVNTKNGKYSYKLWKR